MITKKRLIARVVKGGDCVSACCGVDQMTAAEICIAPMSTMSGGFCNTNCNCINECCGIDPDGGTLMCVAPGSNMAGEVCRVNCECASGDCMTQVGPDVCA